MNARQYTVRAALFTLLTVAVVVLVNYLVDPYGITGVPRIEGVNASKVDINLHTRLLKKYQPRLGRYDTLIVGKSRVEMGLDPSHDCFSRLGMTAYNLGVPGAELRTQFEYTLSIAREQPVRQLLMSVDFTDFISSQPDPPPQPSLFEASTGRLRYLPSGARNPDYYRVVFSDYLKVLFSLDALVSSLRTLALQGPYAPDRDLAGFNPGQDFVGLVRVEGAGALFEQKSQELHGKYGRPWYLLRTDGTLPPAFAELAGFLDQMAELDIAVTLFINPLHQDYWELMTRYGHTALYREWRGALLALLRERDQPRLQLWDFAPDSPYIREAVPDAADRSGPLRWFWEPSHYRRELGDRMIDTLFSEQCGTEATFGERLL